MNKSQVIDGIITVANTVELVQRTIEEIGLEYIAPLPKAIQEEKISKSINAALNASK